MIKMQALHELWARPPKCRSLRAVAVILAVLPAAALLTVSASATMAAVTIGGAFSLTAPDGKIITDQTFRGRWVIVYFGYTSCPDSCPTALADIAKVLQTLGPEADKLQALFITLDPKRDTREMMGEYTASFDPRILGLTGAAAEINAAASAYGAYALRHDDGSSAPDGLLDHSTYIYLMDPNGSFVRAFDHDASPDRIAATLRSLIGKHQRKDAQSGGVTIAR